MVNRIVTPGEVMRPRVVTLPELIRVLGPRLHGWKWAEEALVDLWKLGAPSPDSGPCPCKDPRKCPHVKRLLLPGQFEKWWKEVCARMGYELSLAQAMAGKKKGG